MWVRSVTWVGVAALLVGGLTGCGSKPIEVPVTNISDLAAVCDGSHFTRAAPFTGAPPHPIVVIPPDPGNARTFTGIRPSPVLFLDPSLGDVGDAWTTREPKEIQLVACTERDDDTDSGRTCPFDDDSPTPLRFASYTIHIYEASTGVESGTIQVEARNDRCPSSALVDENDPVVFSTPTPQQYLDALTGFVNWP
jgi:hypothetical protein